MGYIKKFNEVKPLAILCTWLELILSPNCLCFNRPIISYLASDCRTLNQHQMLIHLEPSCLPQILPRLAVVVTETQQAVRYSVPKSMMVDGQD